MPKSLAITASARSEFLDARSGRTIVASVSAYEVRGAEALETAYKRAQYLWLLMEGSDLPLDAILPSVSRRPTHFVLCSINDTPMFKGVFCFHELNVVKICDRLSSAISKDWSMISRIPSEDIKRHCCRLTIGIAYDRGSIG